MYSTLKTEIVGIAPFIPHNGQTANPLNSFAKAIKQISVKKKKTEADYAELARIEYLASLYMEPSGPVIPAVMIEAMIAKGAAKSQNGRLVKAGVVVEKNARLEYEGPREANELERDESFRIVAPVVVDRKKVVRTRPIFRQWSAVLEVQYLPDIINEHDLIKAIRDAGIYEGIGDWRPRHGRFALASEIAALTKKAA